MHGSRVSLVRPPVLAISLMRNSSFSRAVRLQTSERQATRPPSLFTAKMSTSASAVEFKPRLTTHYTPYGLPEHMRPAQQMTHVLGFPPQQMQQMQQMQQNQQMQQEQRQAMQRALASANTGRVGLAPPPDQSTKLPTSEVVQVPEHISKPNLDVITQDPFASAADFIPLDAGEPKLSDEQQKVLKLVLSGKSMFFTGSAGVGKSVLTRAIIRALRAKYANGPPISEVLGVTATTGIAACNIGGCTLHSWAGLGLAKMPVDKLFFSLTKDKHRANVLARWKNTKTLIVDEGQGGRTPFTYTRAH